VVEKFVLSRIVRVHVGKDIKNCVRLRYRRMLVDASAHLWSWLDDLADLYNRVHWNCLLITNYSRHVSKSNQ